MRAPADPPARPRPVGAGAGASRVAAALRSAYPTWSAAAVDRLASAARVRRLRKGEHVGRSDERSTLVMLLLDGCIRAQRDQADGREFVISYLEPGHLIGLVPLFDPGGLLADYVCHGVCTVAFFPVDVFRSVVACEPAVAGDLLSLLSRRLRYFHALLEHHTVHSPARRLAARLLTLSRLYGVPCDGGVGIDTKLSLSDLATLVGVTRPTLSKQLDALIDAGVVAKPAYSRIVVTDLDALRALAEG